jgi:hypothetical protein
VGAESRPIDAIDYLRQIASKPVPRGACAVVTPYYGQSPTGGVATLQALDISNALSRQCEATPDEVPHVQRQKDVRGRR